MMSLKWASRIMWVLPPPLARLWRKRRFEAIRKRDGDAVVVQRILDALDLQLNDDGTLSEKSEEP